MSQGQRFPGRHIDPDRFVRIDVFTFQRDDDRGFSGGHSRAFRDFHGHAVAVTGHTGQEIEVTPVNIGIDRDKLLETVQRVRNQSLFGADFAFGTIPGIGNGGRGSTPGKDGGFEFVAGQSPNAGGRAFHLILHSRSVNREGSVLRRDAGQDVSMD